MACYRRSSLGCGRICILRKRHEDALVVKEAELATMRRVCASEERILVVQSNLASTYSHMGRFEDALRTTRDVYSGRLKLNGEEHEMTLVAANNYAALLKNYHRHKEAKSLLRRTIPVAQRVLGENDLISLTMRKVYAESLYEDDDVTLVDLREAVTTLEDTERTARRVFGGAHPTTSAIEQALRNARAALRARETPPSPPPSVTV